MGTITTHTMDPGFYHGKLHARDFASEHAAAAKARAAVRL